MVSADDNGNGGVPIASRIDDIAVDDELRDCYVPYAVSVATGRAIPDVRDGLKPVQRRILFGMLRMGAGASSAHRKSAAVVGEVMGKFHPHGDSAIYDALVRMAQPHSMRLPLVEGKGNFGGPDDPPAAHRYTEARLGSAGELLLDGVDEDATDMVPTFDGARSEPECIPSVLPNLLINGASGIAVGLATHIPQHNVQEAVAAVVLKIRKPKAGLKELREVLSGPDYPTGGVLVDDGGLDELYETGRGKFLLCGRVEVGESRNRRRSLLVTELPHSVGPGQLVEQIKDLAGNGKLGFVSAVNDETGRGTKGLRVVVSCKPGTDVDEAAAALYERTVLSTSVAGNMVALVDGQPRTLGLVELCAAMAAHQVDVTRRRSLHALGRAEARLHIVRGLQMVGDRTTEVVEAIRSSKTRAGCKNAVMELLGCDDVQAEAILDLRLRRLNGLDIAGLDSEAKKLESAIKRLNELLSSDRKLRNEAAKQMEAAAEQFDSKRSTRISKQMPRLSKARRQAA